MSESDNDVVAQCEATILLPNSSESRHAFDFFDDQSLSSLGRCVVQLLLRPGESYILKGSNPRSEQPVFHVRLDRARNYRIERDVPTHVVVLESGRWCRLDFVDGDAYREFTLHARQMIGILKLKEPNDDELSSAYLRVARSRKSESPEHVYTELLLDQDRLSGVRDAAVRSQRAVVPSEKKKEQKKERPAVPPRTQSHGISDGPETRRMRKPDCAERAKEEKKEKKEEKEEKKQSASLDAGRQKTHHYETLNMKSLSLTGAERDQQQPSLVSKKLNEGAYPMTRNISLSKRQADTDTNKDFAPDSTRVKQTRRTDKYADKYDEDEDRLPYVLAARPCKQRANQKPQKDDDKYYLEEDPDLLLSTAEFDTGVEAAGLDNDVTFEFLFTHSIPCDSGASRSRAAKLDESFAEEVSAGSTLSRVVVGDGAKEVQIQAGKPAVTLKTSLPGSSSVLEIEVHFDRLPASSVKQLSRATANSSLDVSTRSSAPHPASFIPQAEPPAASGGPPHPNIPRCEICDKAGPTGREMGGANGARAWTCASCALVLDMSRTQNCEPPILNKSGTQSGEPVLNKSGTRSGTGGRRKPPEVGGLQQRLL